MFILKKGHQPGVYVPLRALFLVTFLLKQIDTNILKLNLNSLCSLTLRYHKRQI